MGGAKKFGKKLKSGVERFTAQRPLEHPGLHETEWLDDDERNNKVSCGGVDGGCRLHAGRPWFIDRRCSVP